MELDQLKYKMQKNSIYGQSPMMHLPENTIEKITTQKSASLLDLIDRNSGKNMQYRSMLVILAIGIVLYYYDSAFWGYYFVLGSLVESAMIYVTYKLRKNILQSYEEDLPLIDRFKNIQQLISAYLRFNRLTGIVLYFILIMALSLKNIHSFNLASIFDAVVLFRFVLYGLIFYFVHHYFFKKFAKPHQDMVVDLKYYIAELEELPVEDLNERQVNDIN